MARILFVIAPANFRDEEYFVPKGLLEGAGHEIVTASKMVGEINGFGGKVAQSQVRTSEIESDSFTTVVFVGGQGMIEYLNDFEMISIAQKFYNSGKLVCAICIAPAILANAKILNGKNATGSTGTEEAFTTAGAVVQDQAVVTDGNIITADGPASAEAFGEEILNRLKI